MPEIRSLSLDREHILRWYKKNFRPLPWRQDRDPYKIWLSEVMLQQTTVTAVKPYFEKFLLRFPTLESLAESPQEDVLELWAGLGYYSRARNLHKAAQALVQAGGFPKRADELIEFPGFGPYTSRAVSSIAFGERVGVVDGNVIRILARKYGLQCEWWKPIHQRQFQYISDQLAQCEEPHLLNQAMMELGATICTPKSPTCLLCPWQKSCFAFENHSQEQLPLKRPRREREVWLWHPVVHKKNNSLAVRTNDYAPFLKGQLLLPGTVQRQKSPPKKFLVKHSITHHDIYITEIKTDLLNLEEIIWVDFDQLKRKIPVSLVHKVLQNIHP